MSTPQVGMTMKIETEYSNIKINEEINDSYFVIN